MTRPLRHEFDGALYHVTTRGDRRGKIFLDDSDRLVWLTIVGQVCARFHFRIHAFCQMGNHYHLVVETERGALAAGMRQLNGVYSQYFNRRHGLVGHVFQGRYKAILCQKESYLLELARYVVLNPIRAGLVRNLKEWPWSSHRFVMGDAPAPAWLNTDSLLAVFGKQSQQARSAYLQFVQQGIGGLSPLRAIDAQLLLGDSKFIAQHRVQKEVADLPEFARVQRRATAPALHEYAQRHPDRKEAMALAYLSFAYSMPEIARYFGVCTRTVSRAIQDYEQRTGVQRTS